MDQKLKKIDFLLDLIFKMNQSNPYLIFTNIHIIYLYIDHIIYTYIFTSILFHKSLVVKSKDFGALVETHRNMSCIYRCSSLLYVYIVTSWSDDWSHGNNASFFSMFCPHSRASWQNFPEVTHSNITRRQAHLTTLDFYESGSRKEDASCFSNQTNKIWIGLDWFRFIRKKPIEVIKSKRLNRLYFPL